MSNEDDDNFDLEDDSGWEINLEDDSDEFVLDPPISFTPSPKVYTPHKPIGMDLTADTFYTDGCCPSCGNENIEDKVEGDYCDECSHMFFENEAIDNLPDMQKPGIVLEKQPSGLFVYFYYWPNGTKTQVPPVGTCTRPQYRRNQ